MQLFSVLTVC